MGKESEHKHPYMYIVQPEIEPPDANMQSQYRSAVKPGEAEVVDVDDASSDHEIMQVQDEVRVVSTENVKENEKDDVESEEVIEISTGIQDVSDKAKRNDAKDNKRRMNKERAIKKQKKQRFSEMSKEDLLNYLAYMPGAVPRPICNIMIDGEDLIGQVLRKRNNVYMIKLFFEDREETIAIKEEEIEAIQVGNL
ncbi:CotO family spore coat protein [Bacillus sp. 1P06AnD]|uniref:CotO family spore coat protein n=1 Tax=Bacillus sp. 1P06AnD TaxID=3132208 RepID=UPI0039A19E4F